MFFFLAKKPAPRPFAARAILAYLRGNADDLKAILEIAPQDGLTRFLLGRLTGEATLSAYTLGRSEDMTDIAMDLAHAGLKAEAEVALRACTAPTRRCFYNRATLTGKGPRLCSVP